MQIHDDLIFDIGMHRGRDTEYYLAKGFRVVAIEANPTLVNEGQQRFAKEIASERLTIIPQAIVDDDATSVTFYTNDQKDDWGTLNEHWNRTMNPGFREVTVGATRLDHIIEQYGLPHYMKIDIEGADVFCLHSLQRLGVCPTHLSIELMTPDNLAGHAIDCLEIPTMLRQLGYDQFRVSDQSRLKKHRCVEPAREGCFVDFEFDGYCSGPFGNELDAEVITYDRFCHAYLDYFYGPRGWTAGGRKRAGQPYFHRRGWFDVHVSQSHAARECGNRANFAKAA